MMRGKFSLQIKDIHQELVEMGALIERALENAILALTEAKRKNAAKTQKYEYYIDKKEREIERLCMHVLLTQQPVAGDLRLVSAALKMITDMERIGDQAEDISEIAITIDRDYQYDYTDIKNMFDAAYAMVKTSVSSFIGSDLELAKSVILDDDIVDNYFVQIRNTLINRIKSDPNTGEQSLDLLMVIKFLERIGDHACNIAEWVIYSLTGKHERVYPPEHKEG